jgi:hypothetical protein
MKDHHLSLLSHGHRAEPFLAGDTDLLLLRDQMREFPLGRFLLENLGLNGFWTSYVLMHPDRGRLTGRGLDGYRMQALETWLLNECPIFLATQERFRLFRRMTESLLRPGMHLASLPCGLMDDLLGMTVPDGIGDLTYTGIDLDRESLIFAENNARARGCRVPLNLRQADIMQMPTAPEFDLITSNGLNIYLEDDQDCVVFYHRAASLLNPGGYLITSFITPASSWRPHNAKALERQQHLFGKAVPVRWMCTRSVGLTCRQLLEAGLEPVRVVYDSQCMFPTVLARKPARRTH